MKKQVMTLAVCMALTATSAFAACPKTAVKVKPQCSKSTVKAVPGSPAAAVQTPEVSAKQKFEERMAKDREELYCKLGLSVDQRAKADALHKKTKAGVDPLFAKLKEEKAKLRELKDKGACVVKIDEQKLKVKEAKHAIKSYMKASRKEFEAILNKDQLAKFKALKEERKEQMKNCKCKHKHHFDMDDEGFFGPCDHAKKDHEPACPCNHK